MNRSATILLAFVLLLPTSAFAAARERPDQPLLPDGATPIDALATPEKGYRCATPARGRVPAMPSPERIREWVAEGRIAAGSAIPVAFHVILDNKGVGDVPEAWLDAQIEILNRCYSGRDFDGNRVAGAAITGYTFFKASVDRTRSNAWYKMLPGSNHEYKAKLSLGVDPKTTLNIYTAGPGFGLLGWATPPEWLASLEVWDGVVIHWASLPGGPYTYYNLGATAVHEVGHWLGLAHTFEGGCAAEDEPGCFISGDGVCDTPAEASPNFGCPESRDTCPTGGLDPIQNYMDYSIDLCMDQFTTGQDERMDYLMATYRPLIGASRVASGVASGSTRSASTASAAAANGLRIAPNPFNPRTRISVEMARDGRATLRVVDVQGRVVATLADRQLLTAGAHEFPFDGSGLASGVYLLSLRADNSAPSMRRLLLLK